MSVLAAGYVLLRLPHEVRELFHDWLAVHEPLEAARVIQRLCGCRGGRDYDGRFGRRMRGEGVIADLLSRRFHLAYRRLGFPGAPPLDCGRFRVPGRPVQFALF